MEEVKYRILYRGEIAPGTNQETVQRKLAALYNVSQQKVLPFFSGKTVVLKAGVNLETAGRYMEKFEQCGARCFLVRMEPPGQPATRQESPAVPATKSTSPPPKPGSGTGETTFQVLYRGEVLPGSDPASVKQRLAEAFRVPAPKLDHFFTGDPVKIKGGTDFLTAVEFIKTFKKCGAVPLLEASVPVSPTPVPSPAPDPGTGPGQPASLDSPHSPQPPPDAAQTGEAERLREAFRELSRTFTESYKQVQQEFKVSASKKEQQKKDEKMGFLVIAMIIGIVILVNATEMRWYHGLILGFAVIIVMSMFQKPQSLDYVDVFLKRLEVHMQQDFTFFAVVLDRWIARLPNADPAKELLRNKYEDLLNAHPEYELDIDHLSRLINPSGQEPKKQKTNGSGLAAAPVPGKVKPSRQNTLYEPDAAARNEQPGFGAPRVNCPSCGSPRVYSDTKGFSWGKGIATTLFLGPLAGAFVGSSGQGKKIYVCQRCNKKWARE